MKVRILSLAAAIALVLSLSLTASASTASIQWDSSATCTPAISFSGSTATCAVMVDAKSSSATIKVNMILYRVSASGSLTPVASWNNLTGTGKLNTSRSYSNAVSGATYYLTVSGTVTINGSSSPVSANVRSTCP